MLDGREEGGIGLRSGVAFGRGGMRNGRVKEGDRERKRGGFSLSKGLSRLWVCSLYFEVCEVL